VKETLFRLLGFTKPASNGEHAYEEAMRQSSDLIRYMRSASNSTDAARAIMADIWAQNHNVPFLTTVFEAVQEMKTGPEIFRDHSKK